MRVTYCQQLVSPSSFCVVKQSLLYTLMLTCDYKLCHVKRMMMCYWPHLWPLVSQKALQIHSSESRLGNAYRCYWADCWSKYCKAKAVLKPFIKPTANAVLHQSAGTIFHFCIVLLLYEVCSFIYMKFCDVDKC